MSKVNLKLENKLKELKTEFCKYHCDKEFDTNCEASNCKKCNSICADYMRVNFCDNCRVNNYIDFIKDELTT